MAATTAAARLIAPGELRLAHYPPDLLACAYANVGAQNSTKAVLKEYPGCGRRVSAWLREAEYHDPQCATKARQRRWKREMAREG
jgi:hypothetical protein